MFDFATDGRYNKFIKRVYIGNKVESQGYKKVNQC